MSKSWKMFASAVGAAAIMAGAQAADHPPISS